MQSTMTGLDESGIKAEVNQAQPGVTPPEQTNNIVRAENSHYALPLQAQHTQAKAQVHHHFIHSQQHVKTSATIIVGTTSSSSSSSILGPKLVVPESSSTVQGDGVAHTVPRGHSNGQDKQARNTSQTDQVDASNNGVIKKQSGNASVSTVASTASSPTVAEGGSEQSGEVEKKSGGKSKLNKKDRSNLRKGKWTVEEEEYTSRIIHHFSTGLLTLPEGTTLRSYLAEKLNCDPMRITKKFAGASCLGKRVYHLCDRSQATVTDIEMAKAELARLEHRFRLRVEHGQSGVPLPPRTEVVPSIQNPATQMYAAPGPAAVAASWLQSIASTIGAQQPGSMANQMQMPPNQMQMPQPQAGAPAPWPFMATAPQGAHWPAPAPMPPGSKTVQASMQPPNSSSMQPATNEAITLAWAQAAASLTPALSQLAAANLQQHQQQLQKAYESQLQSYQQQQPTPAPQQATSQGFLSIPAPIKFTPAPGQQHHMVPVAFQNTPTSMAPPPNVAPSVQSQPFTRSAVPIAPQPVHPLPIAAKPQPTPSTTLLPRPSAPPKINLKALPNLSKVETAVVDAADPDSPNRSKEDEAAGTMLMGFLTSLRQGFMEAKNSKDQEDRAKSAQNGKKNKAGAMAALAEKQETSSGTTSYPADSSPEDSLQSDQGGKDPSSSEESDSLDRPRGPPRKRLKTKIGEFTSRNVAAHTSRMNALHHAEQQQQSDAYAAGHSNGGKKEIAKSI